jgi:hypothetical protein
MPTAQALDCPGVAPDVPPSALGELELVPVPAGPVWVPPPVISDVPASGSALFDPLLDPPSGSALDPPLDPDPMDPLSGSMLDPPLDPELLDPPSGVVVLDPLLDPELDPLLDPASGGSKNEQ